MKILVTSSNDNSLTVEEVPPFIQIDILIDISLVNEFQDMVKKAAAKEEFLNVVFEKMSFSRR